MAKRKDGRNNRSLKTDVIVKKTIVGLGVFAGRSFKKDVMIGEICGDVYHDDFESDYCMLLDEETVIEPSEPFRFLNHSCMPNAELQLWKQRTVDGRKVPRLWLTATRAIAAGEELTIDYAWPAHHAIPCLCRAEQCRGWIVDVDELAEISGSRGNVL